MSSHLDLKQHIVFILRLLNTILTFKSLIITFYFLQLKDRRWKRQHHSYRASSPVTVQIISRNFSAVKREMPLHL